VSCPAQSLTVMISSRHPHPARPRVRDRHPLPQGAGIVKSYAGRTLESEIDGPSWSQYQGQRDADEKATHVCPPSDTAGGGGLDGEHLKAREELDQEPVSEKDGCGKLKTPEKERKDESGNARSGKTDEVGAQYPCNRPTGPD